MARAVEDDEGDEKEEEAISGSLQYILDGLGNERVKAVHEALTPPHELAEFNNVIFKKVVFTL